LAFFDCFLRDFSRAKIGVQIKHMLNIVELFELPLDGALFFSPFLDFILVHQQHHRS